MNDTPQNLTVKQLDARIIEARMWLASDSPLPWGEVDWCPDATAALLTSEEQSGRDHDRTMAYGS